MNSILAGLSVVGLGVLLGCLGLYLSRRVLAIRTLDSHHEVAGFILGVVGVIYAVLLAFVVIVVWEQFEAAKTAVSEEATHLANIVRLADGLPPEASARIRSEAKDYAKAVLEAEWPAMGTGDEDVLERSNADNLWVVIRDFHATNDRENVIFAEMLSQVDQLGGNRRARLQASIESIPGVMWVLLICGGVTTVSFTYLFRVGQHLQYVMTAALAGITAFVLFMIVALDNPFRGTVSVSPEPIRVVLRGLK